MSLHTTGSQYTILAVNRGLLLQNTIDMRNLSITFFYEVNTIRSYVGWCFTVSEDSRSQCKQILEELFNSAKEAQKSTTISLYIVKWLSFRVLTKLALHTRACEVSRSADKYRSIE